LIQSLVINVELSLVDERRNDAAGHGKLIPIFIAIVSHYRALQWASL
jgi:hypothetical protein